MTIGERIRQQRLKLGYSADFVAEQLNKNRATIYRYESDYIENLPVSTLQPLAKVLKTTPAYLMGWDDETSEASNENTNIKKGVKIPVLGKVAAGIPIEAIEDVLDWEEITEDVAKTGKFFALQIKGDSMSPKILEGDVVIVKQQSSADSGDIVIAIVNGFDGCCKKLIKNDVGITLQSLNPNYEPMVFTNKDVADKPVMIVGKVVELRRKFL